MGVGEENFSRPKNKVALGELTYRPEIYKSWAILDPLL